MVHVDTPTCDPLFIPQLVDEIGFLPPFPLDECLEAVSTFTQQSACPDTDIATIPNALVLMTNATSPPRAFRQVWYVKDRETSFTNVDGIAAAPGLPMQETFRIDSVGDNKPLIAESIAFDGIWAPGETWTFIIQDYTNTLGLAASLYDSIGVPSTASPPSSGSIIVIVPEPASAAALGLVTVMVAARRRR
jgi:hypothetical protein